MSLFGKKNTEKNAAELVAATNEAEGYIQPSDQVEYYVEVKPTEKPVTEKILPFGIKIKTFGN